MLAIYKPRLSQFTPLVKGRSREVTAMRAIIVLSIGR
jgi:hypothetical protein